VCDRALWAQQRLGQILLLERYREALATGRPLPSFADAGLSVCSQNDEDGILLLIFAAVGFRTRLAIEVAAGDGIECNSANLLLHHGFQGVLFEADPDRRERGQAFYAGYPATAYFPPRFVGDWVTAENIDGLVTTHLFPGVIEAGGEIDLLSIDVDGNDYWILSALTCVRPRVIVVEFNAVWGAERSVTVPYDPLFRAEQTGGLPYQGASLPAFVRLLRGRGYRLVGIERLGFNAFFVRNDLATTALATVSPIDALRGPIVGICQSGLMADPGLSAELRARPWQEV